MLLVALMAICLLCAWSVPQMLPAVDVVAMPPDPGADPGGFLGALVDAARAGSYRALMALALIAFVYGLRRYGAKWWKWLATDKGGIAAVLIGGVVEQLVILLWSGKSIGGWLLLDSLVNAGVAGGWYMMIRKLLKPSEAPAPV